MNSLLSLLAVVCALAVAVRAVCMIGDMDWRRHSLPYWQFLALGVSAAGVASTTVFFTLSILSGAATWQMYCLVYSLGVMTFVDRRAAPGSCPCPTPPRG